jgi:hypothetical protein
MFEVGIIPEGWWSRTGSGEENAIIRVRHLTGCKQKFIHPHPMNRPLVVLA